VRGAFARGVLPWGWPRRPRRHRRTRRLLSQIISVFRPTGNPSRDRSIRRAIHELDRSSLGEALKLFTTSRNVPERLQRSTG
jgi:hypothetical protein